jgi:hypothetical protein
VKYRFTQWNGFPWAHRPKKFIDFERFVSRIAIWHGANIDPTEINSGTEK